MPSVARQDGDVIGKAMRTSELLLVFKRRWLIVAPIILIGLIGAGFMVASERTLYRADLAMALVADPVRGQEPSTVRYFWDQNGARNAPALGAALIEQLRNPEVQKSVGGGRSTGNLNYEPGTSTSFAISIEDGEYLYRLRAWAYEGSDASAAVEQAAQRAQTDIAILQKSAGAPTSAGYRVVPVGGASVIASSGSRSLRVPLAIVAGSLLAGMLAGVLADSAMRTRTRTA